MFIPDPIQQLALTLPGDLAGVVSSAENAIAALNRSAGSELAPLARLLLRTESVASSKVEGMQIDARQLARAEANQDTGRNVGREALEILANIDAMQLAIERAAETADIRPSDLIDVHRVLLASAPNSGIAGRVRNRQNWIGGNNYNPCGASFVPPPAGEVTRLMADLCRFVNDATLPPLVQAAVAHAQFETIHPFDDGNGRTGRALVQIILRRRHLAPSFVPPISVILARDKDAYVGGLTAYREGDLEKWIEHFCVATAQAAQLAERYSFKVRALQERWRNQLSKTSSPPRKDAAAWALITILPAYPMLTVPVGVAATGRTKPAIANAITELEAARVLTRANESVRNRVWEADGLLDLITSLDAGEG